MKKVIILKQAHTVVAVCLSTVLLSACGTNAVKQEPVSETESCTRLQGLINDHPNQFNNYKKSLTTTKKLNVWTADSVLPSAKQCQVWEWSSGLHSYACEWQVEKGESQAIANYEEAAKVIQNCLGNAWTAETNTTQSGGKRTVYSNPSLPTIVSIRYFEDTAGWKALHSWNNTLIIGDRSNLNTPLQ